MSYDCYLDCVGFTFWLQYWDGFVDMVSLVCVSQYLEFCDDILVLEDGVMLESGDHRALMKANGRYAQLISNYQMEQAKVKKLKYVVAILLSPCVHLFLLPVKAFY